LSTLSPGIAERAPQPYLALSPDDASALRLNEGEEIDLVLNGTTHRLPVKLHPALTKGVAGLPVGLRELSWVDLPGWGRLSKVVLDQ
jgi:NADH-quinone oxidoreductase subunit G